MYIYVYILSIITKEQLEACYALTGARQFHKYINICIHRRVEIEQFTRSGQHQCRTATTWRCGNNGNTAETVQ